MEKAGYVRREKDPNDGRRVVIQPILEELERVGAGFFGSQGKELEDLISDYDDRDLAVILDLMRKSNAVTSDLIARVRASSAGDDGGDFAAPGFGEERAAGVRQRGLPAHPPRRLRDGRPLSGPIRGDRPEGRSGRRDRDLPPFQALPTLRLAQTCRGGHSERCGALGVEVRGGAARIDADLSGLELSSLVLKGGISDLALTLPKHRGWFRCVCPGARAKLGIHRPAGVEARMSVKGGASKLTFDEQSFDALGGKVRLQSPGYEGATDRYEIELSGGASELTVR